ncbi:hypothetical protein PWT90_08536 [Aphanocladium album]|nr:hypothetical protein PWT90_08536 [Aphanocladium album]
MPHTISSRLLRELNSTERGCKGPKFSVDTAAPMRDCFWTLTHAILTLLFSPVRLTALCAGTCFQMHVSQLPRSCDRCYSIKERCIRAPNSASCDRCARLNHECVRNRAPKRPGRRPKNSSSEATPKQNGSSRARPLNISPKLDASSMLEQVVTELQLSAIEANCLRRSLLRDDFVEQFVIGPSFGRIHGDYMVKQLHGSPSILGHAFVASSMSWGEETDITSPESGSPGTDSGYFQKMYHHATEALSILRSFQPSNAHEMCVGLVLGVTILTFTLKLRVADARAVCRQALGIAEPIYAAEDLLSKLSPGDISLMSCLVLTDVAENLMFCDRPTLRFTHAPGRDYIDRYMGISCTLLPLLYDAAELSYNLKVEARKLGDHAAAMVQFDDVHRTLEEQVRQWMPGGPAGFKEGQVTSTELAHMLCQAEALRNSIRLILHRLRYGFSSQDETAEAIASHILTSTKMTALSTGSVPRCIDFPLIVACLELDKESERAEYLTSLSPISSYSNPFHRRTRALCDAAWAARREGRSFFCSPILGFRSHGNLLLTTKKTHSTMLSFNMRCTFFAATLFFAQAFAEPGSNYNVSREFAQANGCGDTCQKYLAAADRVDLETFGANFRFDFYNTASNFSTSEPGDVLKIQPLDPRPLKIRSGTSIYLLQYTSKDLDGSRVPATAFIALPFAPAKDSSGGATSFPLVAYAHGTSGIYRGCAPSNGPSLYDYDSWQLLIERGYAVVATDYAGLGNNYTLHKYGSFVAQANDVYYSVVAARKAFSIFSKDWMTVGHSQGGATVWKLAESDLVADDKHYLGTVALAPAARLWYMFRLNLKTKGAFLGYAPYHAKALQRVYPSYKLTVLAEPLRQRMAVAEKAQPCFGGLMSLSADLKSDQIVSSAGVAADDAKFQEWENEMSPGVAGQNSTKPVFVVQGLNDTSVLPRATRKVYEDACNTGSEVHLREYPLMEHSPVIAAASAQWLTWIDKRFAHVATTGRCSAQVEHPFDPSLVKAPRED